nr:hypothetical protein [Candidatus Sigynarchaeum springense]MDO8116899.1 hypothetical protein [Candidatus Sigynarchaeota archaeon]
MLQTSWMIPFIRAADERLEPGEFRLACAGVEQDLEARDAVDGRAAAAEVQSIGGWILCRMYSAFAQSSYALGWS